MTLTLKTLDISNLIGSLYLTEIAAPCSWHCCWAEKIISSTKRLQLDTHRCIAYIHAWLALHLSSVLPKLDQSRVFGRGLSPFSPSRTTPPKLSPHNNTSECNIEGTSRAMPCSLAYYVLSTCTYYQPLCIISAQPPAIASCDQGCSKRLRRGHEAMPPFILSS